VKLTGRQKSELKALSEIRPGQGLWSGVEPHNCDEDLAFYLHNGLVMHLGKGMGYRLTNAGQAALERSDAEAVTKSMHDEARLLLANKPKRFGKQP
jgi:hypothetical protein